MPCILFSESLSIWSEDSVEGGGVNVEGFSDLGDGFPLLDEPPGEGLLLFVHLFWSPEANSAFFCIGTTGSGALPNQSSFKFGYSRENGHNHLAGMSGGVGPGLRNGLKAGS